MALKIVQVKTKSQLRKFIKFKLELYKGNPYSVPPLTMDEEQVLNPFKNPAFEFSEAAQFLCYRENKIVGRICAFINHRANEVWNQKNGRFGWFDFIEDIEVAQLLIDTAAQWLRERQMTAMAGPLGFSDMDQEGMLIHGFDQLGTMATLYNYPYYPEFMEKMGFRTDAKWLEYKVTIPKYDPDYKFFKLSEIVKKRCQLRVIEFKNTKQIINEGWAEKFFDMINLAYKPLYGFVELTPAQKANYIKQYIPFVNVKLMTCVVDKDDNLVGVGLALPSLSKALQKNNGKLLPFGLFRLFKALKAKKIEVCDLMLIAVHPDYQGKGVNAIIFGNTIAEFQKIGVNYVESNPELDMNENMRNHWEGFEHEQHKTRVAFIKEI